MEFRGRRPKQFKGMLPTGAFEDLCCPWSEEIDQARFLMTAYSHKPAIYWLCFVVHCKILKHL